MPNISLSTLNAAQQESVLHTHGPCLVLAGAGSGKTRVITHKIARLLAAGVPAQHIAAITFTNKAAAEMRERTRQLAGRAAGKVWICTFHALGVRMLRQDGEHLGLKPQFSILGSDDVLNILKDAGGTTDNATARQWQWAISALKNAGITQQQAQQQAVSRDEAHIARLMAKYHERLRAFQSVDFDDLIGLPLQLLENHDDMREKWQRQLQHLLVDEYQDTNATQYRLLKLLAGERACFTCVGDDDQSIYGWRGATLDNLKQLPADFPQLKVFKLEQNYRSTEAILEAANNLIAPNPKLYPKKLWSALGAGEPVRVIRSDTEEHEAERIAQRLLTLKAGIPAAEKLPWSHFAVLYRANHQAKVLEQALRKAQIPYKVSGGTSFFDRAEIKDLCAWLRLLCNADDDPAFVRAVTTPRRGIGHTTLEKLGNLATQQKCSLFEAIFSPYFSVTLAARAREGLTDFSGYVNDLSYRAQHTTGYAAARLLLLEWLKDIAYEQYLLDMEEHSKKAAMRWENVLDFIEWVAKRCGTPEDDDSGFEQPARNLLEVIQTVSLLSTISEREGEQNLVTLSTLHAAKGLEWPHVVLAGVCEGMLPFMREADADMPAEQLAARLEEERRLMYVGITRAQRTLMVSHPARRKVGRNLVKAIPSRFIQEMQLDKAVVKEDPRARLRALRAAFADKSTAGTAGTAGTAAEHTGAGTDTAR